MAKKWSLGPFQGPNEEKAYKFLAENLPDDWCVIANRQLDTPKHEEVDFFVLADNNLFIIEEKSWGPTVIYGGVRWNVLNKFGKSSERKSPFIDISTKARITATWLRDKIAGFSNVKRHSVIDIVLLTHPEIDLSLRAGAIDHGRVFTLGDICDQLKEFDAKNADGIFKDHRESILRLLLDYVQRDLRILKFADYKVKSRITPIDSPSGIIVFEAENVITGVEYHLFCVNAADAAEEKALRNYLVARELQPKQRSWNNAGAFRDDENDLIVYPFEKPEGALSLAQLAEVENREIFGLYQSNLLEILLDAYTALVELAQNQVLHRTLAPSRIWITRGSKIVFTDFMISHLSGEMTVGPTTLDEISLEYRAPECKENIYLAQEKSDCYALAASFLKIFNLEPSENTSGKSASVADIDSGLEILRTCLVPELAERPAASDVVLRIKELLNPVENEVDPGKAAIEPLVPIGVVETELDARRFGKNYVVQEKLGAGGTGITWLARYESEDEAKLVVIKEARTGGEFENLNQEYGNSIILSPHPRFSRGWDLLRDPKPGAIVNTYMHGMTLKEYLGIGNLPVSDVEKVFLSALELLDHLHAQGYIHGDISPNNILVDEANKVANLIDFGDLHSFGTVSSLFGTRNTYAPEIVNLQEVSEKTDIYSLGATFIHILLGRPHRWILKGDGEDGFECRPMLDEERMQFGQTYTEFIEILFDLVRPQVEDRPTSSEVRHRIRSKKDSLIEIPVIGLQNIVNDNVKRIRSLITSSQIASSGAIAELAELDIQDKLFYDLTYLQTGLESKLLPEILAGKKKVVLLTGNPGGGKTSFLYTVRDKLVADGGELIQVRDSNEGEPEWVINYKGKKFHAILDASQSDGSRTANTMVIGALESAIKEGGVALIAINDGRLKDFARMYEEEYPEFAKAVDAYFGNIPNVGDYVVIDLKNRSVVDLRGKGLIVDSIDSLTQESIWTSCKNCALQNLCPINSNRQKIGQSVAKSRIAELTLETYLKRNERPNFRRIRSAIGYLITGDKSCSQIAEMANSGETEFDQLRLHNLAFDYKSGDILIDSWNGYDPALRISPKLRLWISSKIQDNAASELVNDIYSNFARQIFFGFSPDFSGEIVPEISAYSHLNSYRDYLSGKRKDLTMILQGLSKLSGVHMPYRHGLAVSEVGKGTGWAVIKLIPQSEFEIRVDFDSSEYFDTTPESLTLLHTKTNLNFRMNIDAFELISRAEQGEIFNDFATGAIRFELAAFATRLLRAPVTEAFLMDPSGSYSRVEMSSNVLTLDRELAQNEI